MRFLIIILLLFITFNLSSLIIYIPNDYSEIQQGINACSEGDTVLIEPGVYEEKINFTGNDIVVGSRFILTQDTTYISQTIIKGDSNTGRMVCFSSGESNEAKLIGLTIKNGYLYGSQRELVLGSGIYIDSSSPTIMNNIIENNSCGWYLDGAGIGMENSSAVIQNNIIRNNIGAFKGSGIYAQFSENVIIKENIIHGNTTCSGNGVAFGAAIFLMESEHTLIQNNLFYDNVIDCGWGGAISISDGSCIIVNNTFTENNSDFGGTIHFTENSDVTIYNNIIWNNQPVDDLSVFGESENMIYNNIQDFYLGIGNISRDPLFVSAENNNFTLTLQSPCINSGLPDSQLDPDNSIADMGYMYFDMSNYGRITGNITKNNYYGNIENVIISCGNNTVFPDENGDYFINLIPGTYDITASLDYFAPDSCQNLYIVAGQTLSNINLDLRLLPINKRININQNNSCDFVKIQNAINSALCGDTLIIYTGQYDENLNFRSKNLILASNYYTTQDTSYISQTIINGRNSNPTVFLSNNPKTSEIIGLTIKNSSENCFGVSSINSSILLDKCTISNPRTNAIQADNSRKIVIKNCDLADNNTAIKIVNSDSVSVLKNKIYNNNLGINAKYSTINISNCLFKNNFTAIKDKASNSELFYNNFTDNYASFVCDESNPKLINNKFSNSSITIKFNSQSNGILMNNLITESENVFRGFDSNGLLINNTISNVANLIEGSDCYLQFINSIIWDYENFSISNENLNIDISFSNIQGDFPEIATDIEENISIDPQFLEETDFRLSADSPCINTGITDTTGLHLFGYDLDGNPRIYDQIIDMGCYEYNQADVEDQEINSFSYFLKSYPNPFFLDKNDRAININLSFYIPEKNKIRLDIYNIKGQKIKILLEDNLNKGNHQISWNCRNDSDKEVASGIYFARLVINDSKNITKKMIILQ